MSGSGSLVAELDEAMRAQPGGRRNETLRKVTDLFVGNAARFGEQHVALFDEVMGRLVETADQEAKVELSERLAPIDNAPAGVLDRLAADDSIDIAAPVLAHATRLSERQLAALAATKSRRHMLAIAGRRQLGEQITDALIARGDQQVARAVVTNAGAQVSEKGFDKLVNLAAKEAGLAECLAARADIPSRHFRVIVELAPEPVRRRLAESNPQLAERIRRAINEAEAASQQPARDYSQAIQTVKGLVSGGMLGDDQVQEFAKAGQFEETAAALAVLARLSIELAARLLTSEPIDTLLIAAKAVGLTWPTARQLFLLRNAGRNSGPQDIENARINFIRLGPEVAKHGLQFYKARAKEG